MKQIVFEPTKRFFDHVHERGVAVCLHSCGNVKRFMPYMVELKCDFVDLQARANDLPAYKKLYGDQLGIHAGIFMPGMTSEKLIGEIRKCIDTFASKGGIYSEFYSDDPKVIWDGIVEMYYYSKEFYERERENLKK